MTKRKVSKGDPEWMKLGRIRPHQEEIWSAGELKDRYSFRDREIQLKTKQTPYQLRSRFT